MIDRPRRSPPLRSTWAGLWALLALAGCSPKEATPLSRPSAVPVTVGLVLEKSVPLEIHSIGNVEAYSTVLVRSRIQGYLDRVHFTEGQEVKKDDLLFQIDARPFQAALRRTEANLARDLAQSQRARAEADRIVRLFEGGLSSKDENEVARANAEAMEATVRADREAVEDARLSVEYCTIRSPIEGRTGTLLVHEGNLVKENDTTLVIINKIQPIYVGFSVPEQHLDRIRGYMARGPLRVQAVLEDEPAKPVEGVLTFLENTVDPTTGTVRLKGTFANQERRLWPGGFVDVSLILAIQPRAVVVPSRAVQTGQNGQYVFVVKTPEETVQVRSIVAGRTLDGETVVEKGLEPGEKVVTDGQLRLVPGARVEVRNSPADRPTGPGGS